MKPSEFQLSDKLNDWLGSLPGYQRELLSELASQGKGPDEMAQVWLGGGRAANTAPYGAVHGRSAFYDKFLDELHDLLCSHERYQEARYQLWQDFRKGQTVFVASVTSAIAPVLGAAPAFLAPAVAVTMCAVGKAGLNAWCAMQTERRKESNTLPRRSD